MSVLWRRHNQVRIKESSTSIQNISSVKGHMSPERGWLLIFTFESEPTNSLTIVQILRKEFALAKGKTRFTSLMTFQNTLSLLSQTFKAKSGINHISNNVLCRSKTYSTSYPIKLKTVQHMEQNQQLAGIYFNPLY